MLVEDPVCSGDMQECSDGEIQKHPVSRNQYPVSVNTGNGFRCYGLDEYIINHTIGLHEDYREAI